MATSTATASAKRDTVLDFWRGISILMVLLHHAVYFHFPVFKTLYPTALSATQGIARVVLAADKVLVWAAERSGPLGVKIFFVISGYIITTILLNEERKYGGISIRNFYLRRIFRILPAYFTYLAALSFFAFMGWIILDQSQLVYAFGFLCNTSISTCGWNIGHTWSLAIEEQFYIVWPILFVLVSGKRREYLLAAVLTALLICSAFGIFTAFGWIDSALSFACIAVGALYATSDGFRTFMQRYGWTTIIVLGLVSLVLYRFVPPAYEVVHQTYRLIQPFVILSSIILSYRFARHIEGRALIWISYLGLISYSLYIWQELFLNEFSGYPAGSWFSNPLLMIPFVLCSYFLIERPMIRWARTYTKRELGPGI